MWSIRQLLKMGFENIHVYDFDVIEEHNLPNQLFAETQIGEEKTKSIEEIYNMFSIEDDKRLTIHKQKITKTNAFTLTGVVFCCVDSMKSRKEIYENCYKYGKAELWIEGRIGLFGAYIYTLDSKNFQLYEEYEKTLYDDEEAEVSACGVSQTALPAAVNCATTMIMQMIGWHRGNDIVNAIQYQMPDYLTLNTRWSA